MNNFYIFHHFDKHQSQKYRKDLQKGVKMQVLGLGQAYKGDDVK
jgi:hypothetical protein